MIDAGVETYLVCVDLKQLPKSFAGRRFDHALLADLPPSADPCGEKGEFHSCVVAGPMFDGASTCGRRDGRAGRVCVYGLCPANGEADAVAESARVARFILSLTRHSDASRAARRRCACRPRRRSSPPSASISCVGHGLLARLERHRDGDRLLAGVDARAFVDVEHGDAGDQLAVDVLRGAHDVGRPSRRDRPRRRSRASPAGTATAPAPAWRASAWPSASGMRSRITSKRDQRPFGVERLERARMQFAEMAEHVLRPDLDACRSGRDETTPGRRARPAAPAAARRPRPAPRARRPWRRRRRPSAALLDQWRPAP